jgi:hypothetical protein
VLKLNWSYGKEEKEGFTKVEHLGGVEKDSVDEMYSRNMVVTMPKSSRHEFFNRIYDVLKTNAICTLLIPSWNSAGGYGHPHFKEPLYEGFLYFLNKEWRVANAPEVAELTCDFDATWGYGMHPNIVTRNQEYQQFALSNYCNAATEIIITLKKRSPNFEKEDSK